MKWLSAGLTFVNLSVVCGLLLGMVGHGFDVFRGALSLAFGAAFAWAVVLGPSDPDKPSGSEARLSKDAQGRSGSKIPESTPATWRYRKVWFWLVAAFFGLFAV